MPTIVVFSHLRWDFVFQRPQHLMTRLAEHYDILIVEEPVHTEGQVHLKKTAVAPNITVCQPHTNVPHYGFHDDQIPVLQGLLSGLAHPIIGLDHLAAVVGVGILAALARRGIVSVLAFSAALIAGVAVHLGKIDIPASELLVGLSTLAIGALVATRRDLGAPAAAGLFAIAGLVHGYALGESIVGAEPSPLVAYLAGLLHNVGRLALLATAPKEYAFNFTARDDEDLCAVEQRTLQITHTEAGAWLIERWQLDSFLADSVLYHHEPLARLEAASRERWTTFRPFLATRENPAGTVDRATIDAAVEEAHAKARSAAA